MSDDKENHGSGDQKSIPVSIEQRSEHEHDHKPESKSAHVHGPGCSHDHEHKHEEPESKPVHVHGPECSHEHKHKHDEPESKPVHVHGPGCSHEHEREPESKPVHVHGPGCSHDHEHKHEEPESKPAHVHGPGCSHDHEHKHDEPESKPVHVHGPGCSHDHDHKHEPESKSAHVHGPGCSHDREHKHEPELKSAHVHGPGCSHDHAHEKEHVHGPGPGCSHGHDHGHDHGHAHEHGPGCAHDHHHHEEKKKELVVTHRPSEAGGGAACQFELDAVLPDETDEFGRFERLEDVIQARNGVIDAHVRKDGGKPELCIHYQPEVVSLTQLLDLVRKSGRAVSKRYKHKSWFLRGMQSVECKNVVEYVLDRTGGVLTGNVAYAAERLVVEYDSQEISGKAIEEKVRSLGYELEEPEKGHQCCHHHEGLAANLQMPLAIVAGILIALGLALNYLNPSMGYIANALFLVAGICAGFFAVKAAFRALRSGLIDIESLMVLAGVGAALMGAIFEGAFLLFLFSLGHALEHRAIDKARKAIDALGQLRAETARVRRDGTIKELPVSDVLRGDIMLVRPGDRIALDGLIKEGQTSIDESTITGESIPVAKEAGAEVFAGTCNVDALIEVEVTRLSSETVLSRIIEMISDAEAQKGNSQKMAKKIERTLVPIVLGGAPLLVITLLATGMEFKAAMLRGISLLVAASPCALAIATPAAVLSAIARAAHSGILFKGGAYLEMLGAIDTIAFDKTGTLTVGSPHVMTVAPSEGVSAPELLKYAATAESHSTHPIATAIVKAAKERGVKYGDCTQVTAVHGKGLRAQWEGTEIGLGSMELFESDNVPAELQKQAEEVEKLGQTSIVVKHGSKFLGVLGVADKIRPEAKTSITALKALGIKKNVMLSGDNQRVADAIGQQAGIDEAFAQLLPDEKVAKLRTLAKAESGVAMVGDGVNDAPALAAATIGIAMGGTGSDVALETADIVLMSHGLGRLPFAIKLAREATRTIHQNVFIAVAIGALLVLASIFGWVQVSSAVVLHEGSTLVVLLNGLRLLALKED